MEELRLNGVQNNGKYLILTGNKNSQYRLLIDDALRMTLRNPPESTEPHTDTDRSPRAIQARLRKGDTAETIAEQTGAQLTIIHRYEVPIIAERNYVIDTAKKTIMGTFTPAQGPYWTTFRDQKVSLGELVAYEMSQKNIDEKHYEWKARKLEDHQWDLQLSFTLKLSVDPTDPDSLTRTQQVMIAHWKYSHTTKVLTPTNDLADEFSIKHHTSITPSQDEKVFDIDALESEKEIPFPQKESVPDHQNLLKVLKNMRGQRLSSAKNKEENLSALMTSPRKTDIKENVKEEITPLEKGANSGEKITNRHAIAKKYPNLFGPKAKKPPNFSEIQAQEITLELKPSEEISNVLSISQHQSKPKKSTILSEKISKQAETLSQEKEKKKKRPKVPSWDDIVFGPKSEK